MSTWWYPGAAPAAVLAGGPAVVTPGLGQATWTGFAPTVLTPRTVTPDVGQATWTGFAPTLPAIIATGTGIATWDGFAPLVLTPRAVTPGLGEGAWEGFAPSVLTPRLILTDLGVALWVGYAPTVVSVTTRVFDHVVLALDPSLLRLVLDGSATAIELSAGLVRLDVAEGNRTEARIELDASRVLVEV